MKGKFFIDFSFEEVIPGDPIQTFSLWRKREVCGGLKELRELLDEFMIDLNKCIDKINGDNKK